MEDRNFGRKGEKHLPISGHRFLLHWGGLSSSVEEDEDEGHEQAEEDGCTRSVKRIGGI